MSHGFSWLMLAIRMRVGTSRAAYRCAQCKKGYLIYFQATTFPGRYIIFFEYWEICVMLCPSPRIMLIQILITQHHAIEVGAPGFVHLEFNFKNVEGLIVLHLFLILLFFGV